MNKIRYDIKLIKYISLFETLAGVNVKDCIDTEPITFVVEETQIGKAIGRNGANVKRLERVFNRKIKILEFNPDVLQFLKNLVYPIKADDMQIKDNTVIISVRDNTSKGLLIGRESQNLKNTTQIAKRYFEIDGIKVV